MLLSHSITKEILCKAGLLGIRQKGIDFYRIYNCIICKS